MKMNEHRELRAILTAEHYQNSFISANIAGILARHEPINHFSLEHLRDLHREIFKDFPQALYAKDMAGLLADVPPEYIEFTPGVFRQPVEKNNPWSKFRTYGNKKTIYIYHSCGGEEDFAKVDTLLSSLDIRALKIANREEKINVVTEIYEELDFLHPFMDGNNRTNRVFISQLAESIELPLTWNKITDWELRGAGDLNLLSKCAYYYTDAEVQMNVQDGLEFLEGEGYLKLKDLLEKSQSFQPEKSLIDLEEKNPGHSASSDFEF